MPRICLPDKQASISPLSATGYRRRECRTEFPR
jgi:hypothetical protein